MTIATLLHDATPVASILLCLAAVFGIVLFRRRPNLREAVSLVTAVLNFILVVWMYRRHEAGESIVVDVLDLGGGVRLAFDVDALGLIFALVASSLWILNTLYSIGYMRAHDEKKQTRFYACFAIAIAAVMGGAFSANLVSLFAFYELLTVCTYPLVIHAETPEARAGARRYITYLLGTSLCFFLPAIILTYVAAGTLDFAPTGLLANSTASSAMLCTAFVLFIMGIAKSAIMPFHSWLPAAMVAPTPVSALLHAVAVVKMGVFGVSRVVLHVFGIDLLGRLGIADVLVVGACFTILCGSVIALVQDNLKRRLAYSTISQLSYILLGVGLLAHDAVMGGLFHIGAHAVSKITLFFGAGAIYVAAHKTKVSELDGIGRRMPITMGAFAIASLSMIGVPPTAGLISKWWLLRGAADLQSWAVMAVLVGSTILNACYFLPILWRAFFRPAPAGAPQGVKEAPWPMVLALSVTALGTLALFFLPGLLEGLAGEVLAAFGGAR